MTTTLTKERCDRCRWVDFLTRWTDVDGSEEHLCHDCVADERRALRGGYEGARP